MNFFFVEFIEFDSKEEKSDDSIGDILLWAIVFDRRELAEICWLRYKDHLCKQSQSRKKKHIIYHHY